MTRLDAWVAWFQSHKTAMGGFFGGLAVIVLGAGNIYDHDQLLHAGGLLALIGSTLMGSGLAKSDDFYRDKLKLVETKIDRRNPTSLIPVQDLKKLLADEPIKPVWTEEQRAAERARLEALGRLPK